NWAAQLGALFGTTSSADAEICFATGDFETTQSVIIQTTGHVKVSGAGWGTRLLGKGLETVLRFVGCASVSVRDLSATATRVDDPVDATSARIGGALEFVDCAEVTVDTVTLSCGSAVASGAACLTVRNSITAANLTTGFGTVRVSGSQLIVGQMQTGILLVHVRQAFIDRNEISAAPGRPISFLSSLANARYRTLATRALVGSASTAAVKTAAPDAPKSRARKKSAPAAARAAPAVTATAGPAGGPIAGAAAAPILA